MTVAPKISYRDGNLSGSGGETDNSKIYLPLLKIPLGSGGTMNSSNT